MRPHTVLALSLLCLLGTAQAQGVYKWVDAEGKTHYGSQPPAGPKEAESLKLQNNSFGGNNNVPAKKPVEYNADGTKKIPKEAQELIKGLEKGLQTKDSKTVPLDCMAAVRNAQEQADSALEVGAKNLKDGYITQADYDANATKLRRAKAETTLAACQFSTGKERKFYECMSNGNNHFMACIK